MALELTVTQKVQERGITRDVLIIDTYGGIKPPSHRNIKHSIGFHKTNGTLHWIDSFKLASGTLLVCSFCNLEIVLPEEVNSFEEIVNWSESQENIEAKLVKSFCSKCGREDVAPQVMLNRCARCWSYYKEDSPYVPCCPDCGGTYRWPEGGPKNPFRCGWCGKSFNPNKNRQN